MAVLTIQDDLRNNNGADTMQTEVTKGKDQARKGLSQEGGDWIIEAFSIFKTYHRESQLQAYSIFLCVALAPGLTKAEIERKTRFNQALSL